MALGETPLGPARRRFASGEDIVVARAVLQSTCAASLKAGEARARAREAPNLNAREKMIRELEKLAAHAAAALNQ